MTRRLFLQNNAPELKLQRRQPSQVREGSWPFLFSVDPDRGLVKNLPPVVLVVPAPEKTAKPKRGAAGRKKAWWNRGNKIP
jgi:hypothetical protein